MALSNKQKLGYYKQRSQIDGIILSDAVQDKHVIYGARAINAQLPSYLNRFTDDFDIFSKTPKADAVEIEKRLDKRFGGDFFSVQKAEFPNTWKVKSNVTGKTVVDYTYPKSRVPAVNINSKRYAKIGWIKGQIQKSLKNPNNSFRFDKDREALQRIKLYEGNNDFLFN